MDSILIKEFLLAFLNAIYVHACANWVAWTLSLSALLALGFRFFAKPNRRGDMARRERFMEIKYTTIYSFWMFVLLYGCINNSAFHITGFFAIDRRAELDATLDLNFREEENDHTAQAINFETPQNLHEEEHPSTPESTPVHSRVFSLNKKALDQLDDLEAAFCRLRI